MHRPPAHTTLQRRSRLRTRLLAAVAAVAALVVWAAAPGAGPAVAGVPTVPPEAAHIQPALKVSSGPADRPRIALTFDDNYDLPRAYRTLDVLKELQVPATVFVIGHYQDLGPDLSHRLAADGLEIGDHTRSHADVSSLSWRALQIEIGNGTRTFTELTGRPTAPLFRPPGGFISEVALTAAAAQGFRVVVMWDIDTQDWRGASAAAITDTVLGNAHNGAIVLMHLAAPHTAEALPAVVSGLRDRGYELVTVTELLKGSRRFIDVDPDTAEGTAILGMVDAGYLSGVDDDYFGPFDPLVRGTVAEAVDAARMASASGIPAGIVDDASALLAPDLVTAPADRPVSRLELAQTVARIARAKGYAPDGGTASTSPFADVPADADDDVRLTTSLGLMTAESADSFGADTPAQRRHLAVVLGRSLALPLAGDSTLATAEGDTGASGDPADTGASGEAVTSASAEEATDRSTTSAPLDVGGRVLGIALALGFVAAGAMVGLRLRAQARRRRIRAARRRARLQGR